MSAPAPPEKRPGPDTPSRLLPRLIRFRDAPFYLGMDRNRFNREVRPFITNIRIGKQGIAFDRHELDAWADDYITRNGRPNPNGEYRWDAKNSLVSSNAKAFGTSINASAGDVFAEALKQIRLAKRSRFSPD